MHPNKETEFENRMLRKYPVLKACSQGVEFKYSRDIRLNSWALPGEIFDNFVELRQKSREAWLVLAFEAIPQKAEKEACKNFTELESALNSLDLACTIKWEPFLVILVSSDFIL